MQNVTDAALLADSTLAVSNSHAPARSFTLDTTFVLFFLAMEMGQGNIGWDWASGSSMLTLTAFVVLPYLLPFTSESKGFKSWLLGRMLVTATGLLVGWVLGQATGTLLPEAFRFVPMSLLIVAAIICCNIQIYGILKNRLAR